MALFKTAVVFAFSLFLIGAASTPATAADGADTLVYSHFANAGPLNPHMYSPNQMYAQEMVYEPLVRLGEGGKIEPCLAESWDVSDDGLVYTFHLRKNVRFSDGLSCDAAAVEKNFQTVMANRQRHAWVDLSNRIASFSAVDPLTFKLVLNSPYYPVLEDLSLPRPFRMLSPAAFPDSGVTRDGIKAPVGTGPWKLAESRLGEYDLFVRNDDYWGDKPDIARVLVKVIPDPMSRAMALETGEIDLIYGLGQIGFDTFAALRRNPAFETAVSQPVGGLVLAVNTNLGPTRDAAVRQALQHMVDKDALVKGVFLDSQPKADFLFSPDVPYADVGLKPYAYDPAKAEDLLEKAGWTRAKGEKVRTRGGKALAIDFCFIGNDASHKAIAEVLQGQAARVGVELNLIGEEEDSFFRRQKDGSFGIIVNSTWGPPFEPHAMLASMRQPSHADYQAQLGLPMKAELDGEITRVLETTDAAERRELYKRILATLHDEAVYIPIHYNAMLAAWRKGKVGNFRFDAGKNKVPFERLNVGK